MATARRPGIGVSVINSQRAFFHGQVIVNSCLNPAHRIEVDVGRCKQDFGRIRCKLERPGNGGLDDVLLVHGDAEIGDPSPVVRSDGSHAVAVRGDDLVRSRISAGRHQFVTGGQDGDVRAAQDGQLGGVHGSGDGQAAGIHTLTTAQHLVTFGKIQA